ncbi:MAG: SMP-30/gluconolactonase/LRE family protein [Bacteroidales bacterium]|nr:SMP-30/gluconolactonase/LRE family protein [Bacteroidales bacterium]
MKKNVEVRLLIKILAIFGFVIIFLLLAGYVFIRVRAPHLLEFSKGIAEYRITVDLDSLEGAQFITGMNGCENVLPVRDTNGVYVSCLDGHIHHIGPDQSGDFKIIKSFKAGEVVTGLAMSDDGRLYAAVCVHHMDEWRTRGGSVYRVSNDLAGMERISTDFPSMNGICFDGKGNLYFTSSNFNFFHPDGKVYRMLSDGDGLFRSPEPYILNAGGANGLFYDDFQDEIFFSNTLGGIYKFTSQDNNLNAVYLKLRFMEACDDLCTDISGNIWMTDPGQGTVKMFNPGTNRLVRFNIKGIGQASSCRIRSENGREMLYITELKQSQSPMSSEFNGRGVLIVPAQSLLRLLEPLLIH